MRQISYKFPNLSSKFLLRRSEKVCVLKWALYHIESWKLRGTEGNRSILTP